jgi:DNA modification methylase
MSRCCTLADCTHETNHEEQKIKNAKGREFSWLMDVDSYIGLAHIHHGDCLKIMDLMIEDKTEVDMILCDLPYGKTKNVWDCEIPLSMLWSKYDKLLKPAGVIVLFGQDKFSAKLMLSKPDWHRYNLIWEKTSPTGHLNAKKMPLRSHEDILVFYRKLPKTHTKWKHLM